MQLSRQKLRFLIFCICACYGSGLLAQQPYWQQQVDYTIRVTLDDQEKTLAGDETIRYSNHSPDTLNSIPFHLWMNAYQNDSTAFSEQLLQQGNTRFYFSDEAERGYIRALSFTVDGTAANLVADSAHADIAWLTLPRPLAPGETITIATPFTVKLPHNFSRSGYEGQTFQVAQWYPKPAVYDSKGWHPIPYLDQGEFYSEFGDFDVAITLPQNYIVAASGVLQQEEELQKMKALGKVEPTAQANYRLWQQSLKQAAFAAKKRFEEVMPPSAAGVKTWRYQLHNAHDFAWFASKLFLVQWDTIQLQMGTVDAFTFYHPWDAERWQNSLQYVKDGVKFYSNLLGEYPYPVVSAVLGDAKKEAGGMEYPTITLLEMSDAGKDLDATLAHEIGHNWLYGILASNERSHPWMDEGINTYYENRYLQKKYGSEPAKRFLHTKLPQNTDTLLLNTLIQLHKDQPVAMAADSFTRWNYALSVYFKGSLWMKELEQTLGTSLLDSSMQYYYSRWKFKHPHPLDFKQSLETASGVDIDTLFGKLYTTGKLNAAPTQKLKITGFFNLKNTDEYRYLSLAPALGYNLYDGVMLGAAIHNYQLPLNRFNFLIAPLFATGSRQWNGAARFSYSIFGKRKWLEFALSGTRYNINRFEQYDGSTLFFTLNRIVPSVMYRLYHKDLRITQRWTFQWKSFILNEEQFGEFTTVITPPDTFFKANKARYTRVVNRLNIGVSDNRKLYPYEASLTLDAGKTFVRAGLTGQYFFNYPTAGEGIQARVFAGKFFYLQPKTILSKSEHDRYLFTLTGPHGNEDYTYSDYFLGRNETGGGLGQQIMQRDGFFKVGTPLLNSPVGKTDDWLFAVNVSGHIPKAINPFNALPFYLPVQLFADVGTYGDAWNGDNNTGRFLFDAGIQLSVIHSALNVYIPLVYSKVFSDYYKSFYPQKRFARTVAFSFNLQQLQPNKIIRDLPL